MTGSDAEVCIWHVQCTSARWDAAVLTAEERARAARFRSEPDQRRFACFRYALRVVLGDTLGIAPEAVRFDIGEWGKPEVRGASGGPWFNLSHAGDHALIAVARGGPVGVDLERIMPWREVRPVAPVVFSTAEQQLLERSPDPADLFARLWVWKEAVLKASGAGFSRDPRTVEALDLSGALRRLWRDGDRLWRVQPLAAPEANRAALAASPEARVVERVWT